jgi:hypothetical protein
MKKIFIAGLFLFSCVILLSSWKVGSIQNPKHQVTIIQLQQDGDQTEPGKVYSDLKKQGEKRGIQFYWHQWKSIDELNNFFATNKLSITAVMKKEFSLSAKDGGVRFVTPKRQVTIIIEDQTVYYFLDDPLENQANRIKEILGLRAAI